MNEQVIFTNTDGKSIKNTTFAMSRDNDSTLSDINHLILTYEHIPMIFYRCCFSDSFGNILPYDTCLNECPTSIYYIISRVKSSNKSRNIDLTDALINDEITCPQLLTLMNEKYKHKFGKSLSNHSVHHVD